MLGPTQSFRINIHCLKAGTLQMIKSEWMCHMMTENETLRNTLDRFVGNVSLLYWNHIDYVLGDDFPIQWLADCYCAAPSSKLDSFLTEIDRFHYECQFYSAHTRTHTHTHIVSENWPNAFTMLRCQFRVSMRNSNDDYV